MSQVNFFMLESDERTFLAALLDRPDTVVFAGRFFESPAPLPLRELPKPEIIELTIVRADLLTYYPPILVGSGPYQGMYTFDLLKSAHIDWSRSALHGNALMSGRIYAKVGWLSSSDHNRDYRSWYKATERWLKRNLSRLEDVWWLGPDAEAWSRSGGVLVFGPEPSFRKSLAEPRAT
jgi:hypothetical protein